MRRETRKIATALLEGRRAKARRTRTDGRTMWLNGNRIAWIAEATSAPGTRRLPDRLFTTLAGWNTVTTRERLNGLLELAGHGRPYGQKDWGAVLDGEEIDPSSVQSWRLSLAHPYPNDTLTLRGERVAARIQKGAANA